MADLTTAKRIVIKVGTSTLTHESGLLNIRRVEQLVKVLADLKNSGRQIVLVTSGAMGVGVGKLGLAGRPADMPGKQAVAAVGQCELMYIYDKYFSEYNHTTAQVLLTRDVTEQPARKQNVQNTFCRLLELGLRSGSGDSAMEQIARQLSEESEMALEETVGRVEPTLVVITSVLVGLILLSVMLPLMHIMTAIG